MDYKTTDGVNFSGKRVLLRVDYNVPVENGKVVDDRRIRRTLPLLKKLIDQGAMIILASHRGRPKGKVVEEERMDPVAQHVGGLLGKEVLKLEDCVGESVTSAVQAMKEGDVVLLENLRFHKEEKSKDSAERKAFAKQLAELADVYINEAFANSHRDHASMTGIPKFIPSYAGPSLVKEIETITKAVENPSHPVVAILGGKKGDKVSVMKNLITKVDTILVAGALGFYFLQQRGVKVGEVNIDLEGVEFPEELIDHDKLILPEDAVIAQEFSKSARTQEVLVGEIPQGWIPFDIGSRTQRTFAGILQKARTVIWAGAIGAFEAKPFAKGTRSILEQVTRQGITCIVGGGDTSASVEKFGMQDKITHISSGGGAALKLFAGEELVAVTALEVNRRKFG